MLDNLFGNKDTQSHKTPAIVPQAKPEAVKTGNETGVKDILTDIKAKEKPSAKVLKFKTKPVGTKQGREVEVKFATQGNEAVEPALKEICEAIIDGSLEPDNKEATPQAESEPEK